MKKILLFLIRSYQLSRPFRSACCRFYPSCSSYAYGCLQKHGVVRGAALSLWRLLRCHPFCPSGIDEVPEHFTVNIFSPALSKRV